MVVHFGWTSCMCSGLNEHTSTQIFSIIMDDRAVLLAMSSSSWSVRSSFIYGLGMGAHASTAPACDAAHAVLLELRARFHERAARHTRSPPQCLANTAAETLHDRHWCT